MNKFLNLSLFVLCAVCGQSFAEGMVSIDVELNPVGSFTAKSDKVSGTATKKGASYLAKNIKLELKSLKSDVELRDKHMTEEYFETGKYPTALVPAAKTVGKDKFVALLVIRNTKKKITGDYKISGKDLEISFVSKLSDFKIKKANYMGVGVSDEVKVTAKIPIK